MTTTGTAPSTDQISAVRAAAENILESVEFGSQHYAYCAAVGDVLAWMAGEVSENVFQGYDMTFAAITDAGRAR